MSRPLSPLAVEMLKLQPGQEIVASFGSTSTKVSRQTSARAVGRRLAATRGAEFTTYTRRDGAVVVHCRKAAS